MKSQRRVVIIYLALKPTIPVATGADPQKMECRQRARDGSSAGTAQPGDRRLRGGNSGADSFAVRTQARSRKISRQHKDLRYLSLT